MKSCVTFGFGRGEGPWLAWIVAGLVACGGGGKSGGKSGGSGDEGADEEGEGDDVVDEDDGADDGQVTPPPPGACKLSDDALPPTRVWRLTQRQYANTVSRLFGVNVDFGKVPADGAAVEKYAVFDTFDTGVVHEQFATAAEVIAADVAKAVSPQLAKDTPCLGEAKPAAGCADGFVASFGEKAFRRPLDEDEKARFGKLFDDEAAKRGGPSATSLVIEAMLQSPRFFYRTELGTGSGGRVALTSYELASELAFLLTDEPPDASLLAAAKDGKLKDPATVREHAERLAGSPGARSKYVDFFQQLVAVKELGGIAKDATVFPEFNDDVRKAMMEETRTFVEKTIFDDKAPVGTLFSADFTYVNGKLAPLYGMSASGDAFKKTSLPPERKGILSHGGVLAAAGHPDGTSPTLRGLFIYQRLLCHEKPEPPAGAADQAAGKLFDPASPKNTQRQHFEFAQRNAPECMACHELFMPIGLGLEQFDGIGRHRTTEFDKPIDTTFVAKDLGEKLDGTYKSTLEFGAKLMESPQAQQCLVMQTGTFAFGRLVDHEAQACEIETLAEKLAKSGGKFQELLVELTQQDSFYNRKSAAE